MVKSVAAGASLAAAAALCGSYQAAKVFVPAVAGGRETAAVALRGATSAEAPELVEVAPASSSSAASAFAVVGTAGTLAVVAAAGRAGATRKARKSVALRAAATADAPPPPPQFDPSKQNGVTDPLGFFDPLGFSKVGDEEGFKKLRIAELKHGRVAMMASVGAVIQHYLQFPGFDKVPKGLFAVTAEPGVYGFAALFVVSGLLELLVWKDDNNSVSDVGDYGNPFQLGLGVPLGEGEGMKNRELNNGRAAMIATLGIIVAELATGKDGMQQMGFS